MKNKVGDENFRKRFEKLPPEKQAQLVKYAQLVANTIKARRKRKQGAKPH